MNTRRFDVLSTALYLLVVVACGGCASLYGGLQAVSIDSCYSLPYSEQQQCLEQVRSSYEEYEQDRKEAVSSDQSDQDNNGKEVPPLSY